MSPLAILLAAASPVDGPLDGEVDWARDVAPIVHRHCAECHRPDQAAPFSLLTYSDVRKRARTIERVIASGYMPPWHPVAGHGDLRGERGLSAAEKETLARWMETGMPAGDPQAAPDPPSFASGWSLGEPDLVARMDRAFPVPEAGPDVYRNFCLPLGLEEDVWVRAIEVRPSARAVVHHVLFFYDDSGEARRRDAEEELTGFSGMRIGRSRSLGGWAVGGAAYELPGGLAMRVPAGADLVLQTHFHPSGKPEEETTAVGIWFADAPPPKEIVGVQLPPEYAAYAGLDVPAGDADWRLTDSMVLPVDTELVTVGAHAHYIGREMRAWATLPDGGERRLFYIDDWDFNWQGRYVYADPVVLPAGTTLHVELVYDNSDGNPRNPFHPPQRITWGLESTDEMGAITWVATAADAADTEELRSAVRAKFGKAREERVRIDVDWHARVMRLDADGDGALAADEIPATHRRNLLRMDTNGDGELDASELAVLKTLSRRGAGRDGGGPR